MITATSMSAEFCQSVKAAIARAITKAHRRCNVRGIGEADVFNRKGRYSLTIRAWKGGVWEALDRHDHDVTEAVRQGLRDMHADLAGRPRAPRRTKAVVRFGESRGSLLPEGGTVCFWRGPEFYAPSASFFSSGRVQPIYGGFAK